MKRIRGKGAKPYTPPSYAGKPTSAEMHTLQKSTHSLNDYAKMSPMNMTAANMPNLAPTPSVTQFAAKGMK